MYDGAIPKKRISAGGWKMPPTPTPHSPLTSILCFSKACPLKATQPHFSQRYVLAHVPDGEDYAFRAAGARAPKERSMGCRV